MYSHHTRPGRTYHSNDKLPRQAFLFPRRSSRSQSAEFFHQVVQFGDIVVDVFVAIFGIEFARRIGGFVGGDFFWCRFDIVADLVAAFVSTAVVRRASPAWSGFVSCTLPR
jgi:uncharacterized membrane protein